jgi:tripeptide aminopeptidase
MESAIKIASEIIANLPKDRLSPESTDGKEGFIHPVSMSGSVEEAKVEFILRDFNEQELKGYARLLDAIAEEVMDGYPNSSFTIETKEQYRNMKSVLDHHPQIIRYAEMAVECAGLPPKLQSIRGGTDGSRLSFMGLPCPNIFAGEHAFHGKHEWVSVQDMKKAVATIVNLAVIWEEQT